VCCNPAKLVATTNVLDAAASSAVKQNVSEKAVG
jgi:hypothetical protein